MVLNLHVVVNSLMFMWLCSATWWLTYHPWPWLRCNLIIAWHHFSLSCLCTLGQNPLSHKQAPAWSCTC
uniref:Uncharacterized protein n=1 Tax=Arundo donax TaxID=35708 RepID=A0A0A8XNG6_ARUDO